MGIRNSKIRRAATAEIAQRRAEPRPLKSRKGIYTLKDNFFTFWFRYVFANPQYVEQGLHDALIKEKILPDFNAFVEKAFEAICLEWMRHANPDNVVGRWWDKREEIDIVGINKSTNHAFLAEVKWSTLARKDVAAILSTLERKGELVETGCSNVDYLVIAKNIPEKQELAEDGMTVLDLNDIIMHEERAGNG
jgi:AAA+ ATPase superfamily predicted ATPase